MEKTIERLRNLNEIRSSYYKNSSEFKVDEYKEKAIRIKYNQNEVYDGEVNEQFVPHGQGCLQYANGDSYVGDFKNGLKEGLGQYYYIDGTAYVGFWLEDVKEGDGSVTSQTQHWEFIGKFKNDKPIEGYLDIYSHNINEEMYSNELSNDIAKIKLQDISTVDDSKGLIGDIPNCNDKVNLNALRSPNKFSQIKKRKVLSSSKLENNQLII